MGARSSNTDRNGHRGNSDNALFNGHAAYFYNSRLNAGTIGPPNAPAVFAASGGTKVTSPTIIQHFFTSPGSFIISGGSANIEYLIVAGGGSGGGDNSGVVASGGGGAGGL